MGKRGPKPTPTKILALRGSWLAKTREGEPEVPAALCEPPPWLSDRAKEHWSPIAQTLFGLGVMSPTYSVALAALCEAIADYTKSAKESETQPLVIEDANGAVKANPIHNIKTKDWNRVLSACREFGLTPSAISGIRTSDGQKTKSKKGIGDFRLAQGA